MNAIRRMNFRFRPLTQRLIVLLLFLPLACAPADPPPKLPTTPMQIGTRQFELEIAANDADRTTGLMNRDSMPAHRGMIFVFAEEAPRAFWMKNTRIPLDIIYLASDGTVVDIKQMQPFDLRSVPAKAPARYAIELNLGMASAAGVKIGDRLQIPDAARLPG